MSAKDVETVRELYAGTPVDLAAIFANESALEAWRGRIEPYVHPDFQGGSRETELVGPVAGLDAFVDQWRDWLSAWERWWFETEDFVPAPDGKVVVLLDIRARSRTHEVELRIHGANVLTFKEGKVAELDLYFDRQKALQAAGVA